MDVGTISTIFIAISVIFALCVYALSISWAYNDAEGRGKSGGLVALLVMRLTWQEGLVVWIVFRPDNQSQ